MFVFAVSGASAAQTGSIDGILMSYVSGNEGTDVLVKTSDGRTHRLWFDNLKKPTFEGKALPWCPDFPCDGWPAKLILGKAKVRITYVVQKVDGATVDSPTKLELDR
ncbi:MAG TPA: hypothetical protein VEV38_13885 [Candidatus Eremiobacteraceae bacterium]|nr:hypothetical protein [Candidatus Eremiobacteraceae bacterium]